MAQVTVSFLCALLLGLVLTPLVRALALRSGWITHPRGNRWSQRSTALMGGLAIFGATIGGIAPWWAELGVGSGYLLFAASLMFAIGFADDFLHFKPHTKLIAQIIAAAFLVERGFRFQFGAGEGQALVYLDQALTVIFLVGITNAFNLLDNMDGLCSGIAAIAAGSLTLLLLANGAAAEAALCAALAGACLGFLRYNFAPASIFMGDCGSLFIGLFLAAAALLDPGIGQKRSIVSILALPVLVLLIPLMDTILVTVARKWARRPISQGGCDHSSHRLVAIGLTERRAVLFLYALALAGALVAFAMRFLDWYLAQILLPLFLLLVGGIGIYLGQVRVYEEHEDLGQILDRTPIPFLAQHRYRRRIAEVLIDSLCLAIGFYLACLLRYEDALAAAELQAICLRALPLVLMAHLVAYFVAGVYRGLWRHTSVADLPRFVTAVAGGLLLSGLLLRVSGQLAGMSKTLLPINALVQFSLLTGARLGVKVLSDRLRQPPAESQRAVLLIGGAEEADLAVRHLRVNPAWGMVPAGILSEERKSIGLEVQGTRVLGTSAQIREVLTAHDIQEALLVDPSYSPDGLRHIRRVCDELGVPVTSAKMEFHAANGATEEPPPTR